MRWVTFVHSAITERVYGASIEVSTRRGQSLILLPNLTIFRILKPPLGRIAHFLPMNLIIILNIKAVTKLVLLSLHKVEVLRPGTLPRCHILHLFIPVLTAWKVLTG